MTVARSRTGRQSKLLGVLFVVSLTTAATSQEHLDSKIREAEKQILRVTQHMRETTVAVQVGVQHGSGVLLKEGYVLTSGHVAERTGRNARVTLSSGEELRGVVHATDQPLDVALIKLQRTPAGSVAQLRSRPVSDKLSEIVVAVGNPGKFTKDRASLFRIGRAIGQQNSLQSSCRLARGDSGGPLFDMNGNVVGIHRLIRRGGAANFHTSAVALANRWKQLTEGSSRKGEPAKPPPTKKLPLLSSRQPTKGVVSLYCGNKQTALGVVFGSSRNFVLTKASEITTKSLRVGNQELQIPATIVGRRESLDLAILKMEQPWSTGVLVQQAGNTRVGQLLISARPRATGVVGITGAKARAIASRRGEFGISCNDSLVVAAVEPNSAAKAAGLRVGDTITSINKVEVHSMTDVANQLRGVEAGQTVSVSVKRAETEKHFRVRLLHPARFRFDEGVFQSGAAGPSSLRRTGFPSVVQHDADISANECGGPVFDLERRFIGINIARVGREAVYMIPAARLIDFARATMTKSRK